VSVNYSINENSGPPKSCTLDIWPVTSKRLPTPALDCRTRACLLCMFVPTPTSLIKVVNSGSYHLGIVSVHVFSFHVGLPRSICRWRESKNIIRSNGSLEYVRSRFTRAHPLVPSCPLQLSICSKLIHIKLNVFWKQWVSIEHWTWIPSQWTVSIQE